MAISLPRISRNSSALMVFRSRPLNLMVPPTTRPFTPKSCIIPKATVDLPHPDSPTKPTASPGWTVTEKSMTAGISRKRVKNEIDKLSISKIGPSYSIFDIRTLPVGDGALGPLKLIFQAFFAQTIRQQIQPQNKAEQGDRRHQSRMRIDGQQFAPFVNGGTPIRILGRKAQTEKAQCSQKDGGVANAQTEIHNQRTPRIWQNFP